MAAVAKLELSCESTLGAEHLLAPHEGPEETVYTARVGFLNRCSGEVEFEDEEARFSLSPAHKLECYSNETGRETSLPELTTNCDKIVNRGLKHCKPSETAESQDSIILDSRNLSKFAHWLFFAFWIIFFWPPLRANFDNLPKC